MKAFFSLKERTTPSRFRRVVLAAVVLLLVIFLGGSQLVALFAPTPRVPDPDMLGMVIRDPWYDFGTTPGQPHHPNYAAQDRMGEMLALMGVRWVRIEFHIDGSDTFSTTQVARNDYFIREVAPRHNIKVLGLLSYGLVRGQNPLLLGEHSSKRDPIYGAHTSAIRRLWLNRARMIADRYRGDIAAYELFNEPNRITQNGDAGLPPAEVAHLHTTFYRFFHHIDRNAPGAQAWRDNVPLILGGPQPAGTGERDASHYVSDHAYLRQIYTSPPFMAYQEEYGHFPLDGLGYHLYPQEIRRSLHPPRTVWIDSQGQVQILEEEQPAREQPPTPAEDVELVVQRLDSVRALLIELGDPHCPFWITEIGYNALEGAQAEQNQAEFLHRAYTTLAARPDVAHIFWFKYEDFPPTIGYNARRWGTLIIPFVHNTACPGHACYDVTGRPVRLRPSFWAYRELAGKASLPEPPAHVRISGARVATVGQEIPFTAHVSRASLTRPITYTWQATDQETVTQRSDVQNTRVLRWQEPGTYTVMVEARNASGTVVNTHLVLVRPSEPSRP